MAERLEIKNVYKIFAEAPAAALAMLKGGGSKKDVLEKLGTVVGLNDVSLTVPAGAIYMVMGLSGSGKSTLARCINRLVEPNAGQILLDGSDVLKLAEPELRSIRGSRIAMVFQHFALLPNKRVIENVEFGLKLRGVPKAERRRRADEVLSVVGLDRWGFHFPHELSGGMKQRVGLARALAADADVLIMDEAFSALDPLIRTEMQDQLLLLQRKLKKTILFITHDFQEALKLGTRIAIMYDGAIVREGTPQDIVTSPGSDYVAAFTREIDRARLFDAASIVERLDVVGRAGGRSLVSDAARSVGFLLDDQGRVIRALGAQEVAGDAPWEGPGRDFVSVSAESKLIDIAGCAKPGVPIAVLDGERRFAGVVRPDAILAQIAGAGRVRDPAGGPHA